MIPKILHRVWLDEPIPTQYDEYWAGIQRLHPDWELRTWNSSEELLGWMQNAELFSAFTQKPEMYGFRSDISRYEILNKFGGVYVDTDVEGVKPFDSLLGPDPFIAWCSLVELDPSIIASPPGHPAITQLVDGLGPILQQVGKRRLSPPGTTGPSYVTTRWRAREDVRRLPPQVFFPYHWTDRDPAHARPPWPPQTVAVHRWKSGWKPSAQPVPSRARGKVVIREPVYI